MNLRVPGFALRAAARVLPCAGLLAALLAGLPSAALATAPVWLVPAGGETWTAGTTHTLEWSGGDPQVTAVVYFQTTIVSASVVAAYFPNTGYASWTIPANLPPGTYTLAIGADPNAVVYSGQITIKAPPECLYGCSIVSASMPPCSPYTATAPAGACGYGVFSAYGNAQSWMQTQLASQCFAGYAMDPSTMVVDYTLLPVGGCLTGFAGMFVVEASGYACCCQVAVPTRRTTWGGLKSHYR